MKVVFIVLIVILFPFLGLCYFRGEFLNSNIYKLHIVIGKKGVGKTTFIMKKIVKAFLEGRPVYCNFNMPLSRKIDMENFGGNPFPEGSLVLLDEISLGYDNRNFRNFDPAIIEYLRLQRHYKNEVGIFSQSKDCDKKFIDLSDVIGLQDKPLPWFSRLIRVDKALDVVNGYSESNQGGKIIETFKKSSFLSPKSRIGIYIPRGAVFFDSFERPNKEDIEYTEEPITPELLQFVYKKPYRKGKGKHYGKRIKYTGNNLGNKFLTLISKRDKK